MHRRGAAASLPGSRMPNLPLRWAQRFGQWRLTRRGRLGFELLITVDQNMASQQSLRGRSVSLLVIRARTTNLDDLLVWMPDVLNALTTFRSGDMVRIGVH